MFRIRCHLIWQRLQKQVELAWKLDVDMIPISEAANELSAHDGVSPLQHALTDGEDFELILTASPDVAKQIIDEFCGSEKLSVIGRIIPADEFWLCHREGPRERYEPTGYSH